MSASEYIPSPSEANGHGKTNGNGHYSRLDDELSAIRNFHKPRQNFVAQRHPKFFIQSCSAYWQIFCDPKMSHLACRLFGIITEASLKNVLGSDQKGSLMWTVSKFSKLAGAKRNTVCQELRNLVKHEYLLVEKVPNGTRYSRCRYYVRAIITDRRIQELEGTVSSIPMDTGTSIPKDTDTVTQKDYGTSVQRDTGTSVQTDTGTSAPKDTLLGRGLGEGLEGQGRGSPPAMEQTELLPVFDPIQPGLFESTLRLMQQECDRQMRQIRTKHVTAEKVFLQAGNEQWYLDQAKRFGRNDKGKKMKADYTEKAAKLRADPENWKERKILTAHGQRLLDAWKARSEEIGRRLVGAH